MNSMSTSKKSALERRPTRMLKEFLHDDDNSSNSNSRSSSGPTQHPPSPSPAQASLPRSRSKSRAAAEAAVSSIQKLLKSLHLIAPSSSSSPPPAMLPRSISKRFLTKFRRSSKKSSSSSGEGRILKVRDILRWRSFRDGDKSPPSDFPATTAATTTSGSGADDGDFSFTADELPRWWRVDENRSDVVDGGDDLVQQTTAAMDAPIVGPEDEEDDIECDEEDKEQHSPVSVLNSPFRDEVSDEEAASAFDQSLANVERTKQRLLQSIQWLESLAGVEEHSTSDDNSETETDQEEEEAKVEETEVKNASELRSRDYMFKVLGRLTRREKGVKVLEECIKDMSTQWQWGKFGEERGEIVEDMEACLLHDLVDEILVDFFG